MDFSRFSLGIILVLVSFAALGADKRDSNRTYSHASLRPVRHANVRILDGFWKPIRDRSREVGVPDYLQKFEAHGYIDNFRYIAKNTAKKPHGGPNCNEFVYKLMEAMAWYAPESARIRGLLGELSDTVLSAQQEDGYLNTYYANPVIETKRFQPGNRFEFYNFAHFTQAAIAHYRTMGNERLLDAAEHFAGLIVQKFADPNDLPYETYRGPVNKKYEHPNHELAMVELWRVKGDERYRDFVRQTLEEYEFFGPKFSDIWGHAVQETLLQAGAADLYLETEESDIWKVVSRLWKDMRERHLYIIGGVGNGAPGEAYGEDYHRPLHSAYCETCAAISLVFWNHKMLLATGDPKYADLMERSLYNNVLSGISLDGTKYFYRNHLAQDPEGAGHWDRRQEWFNCSCCPPNVHRLLASLNRYIYTRNDSSVQVNLYVASRMKHTLGNGTELTLTQRTEYPWKETIELEVDLCEPASFELALRVPAWCTGATAKVNGNSVPVEQPDGGYTRIERQWQDGDTVELRLPMKPRKVTGDTRVESHNGRLAIMRGPVVYCLEGVDNPVNPDRLIVPKDTELSASYQPGLLKGVVTVRGTGRSVNPGGSTEEVELTAIPYYAWANRAHSWMRVWLAHE